MFDRILVKELDDDGKTTGGIQLLDGAAALDGMAKGKVVAVGPGRRSQNDVLVSMTAQPGDKVLYQKGVGVRIKVDREDLLLMFEGDLIGIIK